MVNEKCSVASRNGAVSIKMVDILAEDDSHWVKFQNRMSSFGVQDYKCISADIGSPGFDCSVAKSDIVHCSGVLYHHPDPMLMLSKLREMTGEYLVLTSVISQERVENRKGTFQVPPSGVVFVPSLRDEERDVLKVYWQEDVGIDVARGIIDKVPYDLSKSGPWWWLPTENALRSMIEVAGFEIESSDLTWSGNALTSLLKIRDA